MSHLFAFLSRMKFIRRWGLMHNTYPENIQEHSLRVAMIAHCLAVVRNTHFNGRVSPERTATLALFHDVSEVLTGDLPTPVKYSSPDIRDAYKAIESSARKRLFEMVPKSLRPGYRDCFEPQAHDREHHELIAAADKLCAYLKCLEEARAGNPEFIDAEQATLKAVNDLGIPETTYFLETFAPSVRLTLDELS